MNQNKDGLTLTAVVDRFKESESVLGQLQDKLRRIAMAEEGAVRNSELLDVSAVRLAELTTELSSVVGTMAESQSSIRAACETAEAFLDSTDIRRVDQRLEQVESRIDAIHAAIEGQNKELRRAVEAVGELLSRDIRQLASMVQSQSQQVSALSQQVDDADQRSSKALGELDQLRGVLPGRLQRRL